MNKNPQGGPISIKTAKWKGSIYFGDALRQFDMDATFTLILGFWKQVSARKKIVKITENVISMEDWKGFWGAITRDELLELDKLIKDRKRSYQRVRSEAQKFKLALQPKLGIITLNPKIDSKTQRRLQCSIPFAEFFKHIVKEEPRKDKEFLLWGRKIVPPLL